MFLRLLLTSGLFSLAALAADDIWEMDIDQLAQIRLPTSVATLYALPQRESPAVLTIITAEQIRDLHARDLVDIFQRVPGFQITQDIAATTFSVRGLYAFEGRALVMVNGLPLNELMFGGYPIGNDFPIHLIQRIEIIRGPGSVIYGGSAETAVINLVIGDQDELRLDWRLGQLPDAQGHHDIGVQFAQTLASWRLTGLAFAGNARRSDAPYTYFDQRPAFEHSEKTAGIETNAFLVSLKNQHGTTIQALHHTLHNNIVRGFAIPPNTPPDEVDALIARGIDAQFRPAQFRNSQFAIESVLWQHNQQQWHAALRWQHNHPFERPQRDDVQVERLHFSTRYQNEREQWFWLVGAEWFDDEAQVVRTSNPVQRDPNIGLRRTPDDDLHNAVSVQSYAAFANVMWHQQGLRVFAGVRWDAHALYDSQLSPRLGLTWHQDRWYLKGVLSDAFHAPLTGNTTFSRFGYDPNQAHREAVVPERSRVYEMELGYVINDEWFVSANVFYQHLHDVIEFRYNVAADDLFSDNGGSYGSTGFELELRGETEHWNGLIALSYATPKLYHDNNSDSYQSDPYGGDTYLALHAPEEWLGISDWKIYANLNYRLNDYWSIQTNITHLTEKNASVGQPFGQTGQLAAQTLVDIGLWYQQLSWRVGVSLHDVGNERLSVVAPFIDSGFDTLAYKGRELSVHWQLRW